ncbi:hypothetical protein HY546_01220 [archaeon]|nr:hypothetical protein [archaeon]
MFDHLTWRTLKHLKLMGYVRKKGILYSATYELVGSRRKRREPRIDDFLRI